ncbi:hypothetical protein OAS39_11410 [Pirellulales bacterium]|nr:hypothetical protein [Pirellulales bacterium]
MATNPDIYVEIGAMSVKKSGVDAQFKDVKLNKLPPAMTKAATAYFKKKSGFTTQKPKEEGPAFCVSGTVVSLTKKSKGKDELIMASVIFALITLPDKKLIAGKLEGIAGTSISKKLQGDAEFAAATAAEQACEVTVQQIGHAMK